MCCQEAELDWRNIMSIKPLAGLPALVMLAGIAVYCSTLLLEEAQA